MKTTAYGKVTKNFGLLSNVASRFEYPYCTYGEIIDRLSSKGWVISLTPAARGWKAIVSECHDEYTLIMAAIEKPSWEEAAEEAIRRTLKLMDNGKD